MTVTSLVWLAWMLGVAAVYWAIPARLRTAWLIAVSAAFLVVYDPESAAILGVFLVATYHGADARHLSTRRAVLVCALLFATLAFYKMRLVTGRDDWLGSTVIPLGISYYTFRCLHYVLERYKGTLRPHGFLDFTAYLLFLPTILAGPIHRFPAFRKDMARRRWDSGLFAEGLERILYGYFKIMVIGVYLLSEQWAMSIEALQASRPVLATYLGIIERTLYGYFTFAGYSDIAIGFARLLGFRVMENFDWPFIRKNISEFWRSWHISLTSFVREYAYMPLFAVTRNAALAAVVSMILFGLWHEFSMRYILWGAWNGAGIALWQAFQGVKPALPEFHGTVARHGLHALSILLTFHFVAFGFVLTFEPTVRDSLTVYATLLTGWW